MQTLSASRVCASLAFGLSPFASGGISTERCKDSGAGGSSRSSGWSSGRCCPHAAQVIVIKSASSLKLNLELFDIFGGPLFVSVRLSFDCGGAQLRVAERLARE